MTFREVMDYEIRASRWTGLVSWPCLQSLAARYFAWKVGRKWRRYESSVAEGRRIMKRAVVETQP